jgi:hypothetical protein
VRAEKLTSTIAGWKVAGQSIAPTGAALIEFEHGAHMALASPAPPTFPVGKKVHAARQSGASLQVEFEDGTIVPVPLAGPTSSVQVEDENGKLIYMD